MPGFDINDPSTFKTHTGLQRRNYNYKVEVVSEGVNGLPSVQHVTIASNALLTESQVLLEAGELIEASQYKEIVGGVTSMSVTDAIKSQGL